MIKLNVAAIPEGSSNFEAEATLEDVDLVDDEEFKEKIRIVYNCNRVGNEMFIKTALSTTVDLNCDLCLEPFQSTLSETVEIVLTRDAELVERGEEDVYLFTESTSEVDITESVKQSLLLAVPFKKVCKADCKGLCPTCGANLNIESCSCTDDKIDPRWQALKEIFFDDE
ncbi:DUF177 domain-containing protein [candidate division KSB1 bacterium]|nr:DUF177 domain-containing protein [candidate division KSB1 bacterium]RQW06862.1 MAG: DUF177 domain-containing protein [candidate division KSB1 bacterium]